MRLQDYTPPFARPTASVLVKDRLKGADLQNREDLQVTQASANVIEKHNETLRQERTLEPER